MPGHTVREEPFPNIQPKAPDDLPLVGSSHHRFPSGPPAPQAVHAIVSPQGRSHLPPAPQAVPAIFSPQGCSCFPPAPQGRSRHRLPSGPFQAPPKPPRAVPASLEPLMDVPTSPQPLRAVPGSPQPLRAVPAAMFRGHRAWFSQSVSPGPRGLWGEGSRRRRGPGEPQGTELAGIRGETETGTALSSLGGIRRGAQPSAGHSSGGTALSPLRGSETHTTRQSMSLASPCCPYTEEKLRTSLRGGRNGSPTAMGSYHSFHFRACPCGPTTSCPHPRSAEMGISWMPTLISLPIPCSRRWRDDHSLAGC